MYTGKLNIFFCMYKLCIHNNNNKVKLPKQKCNKKMINLIV